ncbi:MAG: amidohydrolase family protein [Chloracidobacterium sp.]|nr:amidohydrolase family protein [Chloracidobacterium sp.]
MDEFVSCWTVSPLEIKEEVSHPIAGEAPGASIYGMYRFIAQQRQFCRTCLALICIAAAMRVMSAAPDDASAPVLFYDAQIFTAEFDHPYAEAIAIRGDRILAVGALGSVERIAGPIARKVDLHGKFLMPGMIDAHVHPIYGGIALIQTSFSDKSSVVALVQFVAEQLKKRESMRGDVLMINNIDPSYWTQASEIDAALSQGAFAKHPIVLVGSDGHSAWANRVARTRAGITQEFIRTLKPGDRQYYGFDAAFNRTASWSTRARTSLTEVCRRFPPTSCTRPVALRFST